MFSVRSARFVIQTDWRFLAVHSFVLCRLAVDHRLALDVIDGGAGVVIRGSVAASLESLLSRIHPGAALVILPLIVFPVCELLFCSLWACSGRHEHQPSCDIMPKDISVDDDPEFPFPGEYTPNGFATQYIRL
jgi:hypothetical protein